MSKEIEKLTNQTEKKKEHFAKEFEITIDMLIENYPRYTKGKEDPERTELTSRLAVATILIKNLQQMQADSTGMLARDFHKKYFPNLEILDCSDFTRDEVKDMIEASPFNDTERRIAMLFFYEGKNQAEIYEELTGIGDKKTISAKLDDIAEVLRHTATLYNI